MADSYRIHPDPAGQPVVETRFRVRYCETDRMGIVHHAAYIAWFEEGRSAFTRAIGYPYAAMEADGISLAVTEAAARYHLPARYDEEVVVATTLTRFPSRGMAFAYTVRRAGDGAMLASGSSTHVAVDGSGAARRIPDAMRGRLEAGIAAALEVGS